MIRTVKDRTILEDFAGHFIAVIEKHAKYAVVSGFVVIAHGRSRGTEDIDMLIEKISRTSFVAMHNSLCREGFECLQGDSAEEIYDDYLKDGTSIRYVLKGALVPEMELRMSKDGLDEYQIATRKKLPLTGLNFFFSSVEMNIAFKEELLKSEKDIEDVDHLRLVYGDKIDEQEIEKIKSMIRRFKLS